MNWNARVYTNLSEHNLTQPFRVPNFVPASIYIFLYFLIHSFNIVRIYLRHKSCTRKNEAPYSTYFVLYYKFCLFLFLTNEIIKKFMHTLRKRKRKTCVMAINLRIRWSPTKKFPRTSSFNFSARFCLANLALRI